MFFILVEMITTFDIVTDIIYVFTLPFYNQGLHIAAIFFTFLVPAVVYIYIVIHFCRSDESITLIILMIIMSPIFVQFYALLIFLVTLCKFCSNDISSIDNNKIKIVKSLAKVQCIFHSSPQLIIQGLNNSFTNDWNLVARMSYTLSILSVIQGIFVFTSLLSIYWTTQKHESIVEDCERILDNKISEDQETRDYYHNYIIYRKGKEFKDLLLVKKIERLVSTTGKDPIKLLIKSRVKILCKESYEWNFNSVKLKKSLKEGKLNFMIISVCFGLFGFAFNIYYLIANHFEITILKFMCGLIIMIILLIALLDYWDAQDYNFKFRKFVFLRLFLGFSYSEFLCFFSDESNLSFNKQFEFCREISMILCWIAYNIIFIVNNYQSNLWSSSNVLLMCINILNLSVAIIRTVKLVSIKKINSNVSFPSQLRASEMSEEINYQEIYLYEEGR